MFSKYRELGLALIPLKPNSKAPLLDAWTQFCDRLPTEEESDKWERFYSGCYGLACGPASGVMWVDIDSDDPKVLDAVKPSPVRKRGRKGESRAFRFNPDIPSCKVAGIIDILAHSRQTVLPPTVHPETGKPYVWVTPDTLENFSVSDLPEFTPDDLSDLCRTLEPEKFDVGDSTSVPLQGPFFNDDPKRRCPHGSHDRLKRIVSAIIARGASPDEAVRELLRYDEENHRPVGYFSDDTRSDCFADPVSNALFFYSSNLRTFNRRQVKSGLAPSIPLVSGSELIDVSELVKPKGFEASLWPEPLGILKELRDQIAENQIRFQPGIAIGGAIAIASAVIGNKFKFGSIWPNAYVINVADTGSGKQSPYSVAKRILNAENGLDLLGAGGYRSSTALIKDLLGRRERLDLIDECSSLFSVIKSGGVFQSDMLDILNLLWSDSNSLFIGPEAAGREKIQVYHPCVSILFSTTPDGLKNSISREFITKGFIPRSFIFYDQKPGQIIRDEPYWNESRAEKLTRFFQEVSAHGGTSKKNLVSPSPSPEEIPCDPEAKRILSAYGRESAEKLGDAELDEIDRQFYSRAAQLASKLALIQGAFNKLCITPEDARWAIETLETLRHNSSSLLPQMGAENTQESNLIRVLQFIKAEGSISMNRLTRKTQFLKTAERNEILASLETGGRIRSEIKSGVGRPVKQYVFLT